MTEYLPVTLWVIEIAGTTAFAISGIRLAAAKDFDWFGALAIGFVTATGGGTLRDLLLNQPPFWMLNPASILCTLLGLLTVLLFSRKLVRLDTPFFIFDTIGLALFVVLGLEKTLQAGYPHWVAILLGTLTGVAGGILRDLLIHEIPLVFRKEVYALACIIGGFIYWIASLTPLTHTMTQLLTAVAILLTRLLAVRFHWTLPKIPKG
jgi:uncharacterized membrane protein YeiH